MVDVFIRCSTVPIAVVAPMYAPFYDSTARERLPETDPLLSFSVRRRAAHCVVWQALQALDGHNGEVG